MAHFDDLLADACDLAAENHGETIVYHPPASARPATPVEMTAILFPVHASDDHRSETGRTKNEWRHVTIFNHADAVSRATVMPVLGGQFEIDGQRWDLEDIVEAEAMGRTTFKVIRKAAAEKSRAGLRRR